MSHLRDLERSECLELISSASIGRVAVVAPDGPYVVPVNFAVVDGAVAMRTSPYSILGTYARDSVVAFEVDEIDDATRGGWSVQVRGRCEVETDPGRLASLRAALADSWVSGSRTLYLRLRMADVTGRAVGSTATRAAVVAQRAGRPTSAAQG